MRVDVMTSAATVRWNDQGDDCEVLLNNGTHVRVSDAQLRELYDALAFLFERSRG